MLYVPKAVVAPEVVKPSKILQGTVVDHMDEVAAIDALLAVNALLGNLVGHTASPLVYPKVVPAGQVKHVETEVAPVLEEYVPALHEVHTVSPVVVP